MTRLFGRFRPTFWPTVIALPLFILMVGLGVWQLQRLEWKTDLLAQIDARAFGPALALPERIDDPARWNYQKVTVTGRFDHQKEIHLFANKGAGYVGYEVITPLIRADGSIVLIDRGWVPTEKKTPQSRPQGQVEGVHTITGIARMSQEKPWAVPANRPGEDIWFYGNIAEMEAHLGIDALPVFVQADATPNPGGWPEGGQTNIDIPNDHLEYAITWFGLAIVLAVIYFIYHLRPRKDG